MANGILSREFSMGFFCVNFGEFLTIVAICKEIGRKIEVEVTILRYVCFKNVSNSIYSGTGLHFFLFCQC